MFLENIIHFGHDTKTQLSPIEDQKMSDTNGLTNVNMFLCFEPCTLTDINFNWPLAGFVSQS